MEKPVSCISMIKVEMWVNAHIMDTSDDHNAGNTDQQECFPHFH